MLKRENTLFNEYKENLYLLNNIDTPNTYRDKIHNFSEINTNIFNNDNSFKAKDNYQSNINMDESNKPLKNTKINIIKNNKNESNLALNKHKSFNKIIQKEIVFNNSINLNSPIKKRKTIHDIPINNLHNNYFINFDNYTPNEKNYKKEKGIKNIHISLKKIKLGNQSALSKNQSQKNKKNEAYIHKSPKRKKILNTETNIINNDTSFINKSYNNSNLFQKINISAKKNNLIPKPNINREIIRKNMLSDNIFLGNKKIDKSLLNQSKEIKMKFKKDNEIIKMKNEFFDKNGILPEHKIDYENKTIKIQSHFRKFLVMKKLYRIKNKFFAIRISKVNNLIIQSQKNVNINNDKNYLINKKYILKYLLLKKEKERFNILKIFFNKYKNKTINSTKYNKFNKSNDVNNNISEMRTKKLRHLIDAKSNKVKQILLHYFLQYYYNSFYINLNLFINICNQIILEQKADSFRNTLLLPKKQYYSYNDIEKSIKSSSIISKNKQDNSSQLINDLRKDIFKMEETTSEELKKFYLRDVIRTINKFGNEQYKCEKEKNMKNFVLILFSKIKHILNNNYINFYYKLVFMNEIKIDIEKKMINKIKDSIKYIKGQQNNALNKE